MTRRMMPGMKPILIATLASTFFQHATAQSTPGPPDTEHICAPEDGVCVCSGYVRYGSGSTFTPRTLVGPSGSINCTTAQFGDPAPGTAKECRCSGTGIFGVTLNVYPSTSAAWVTRPVCGGTPGDVCCSCTLTGGQDRCSNATGCVGPSNSGGTASGYTCSSCPCKNPGVGCMAPQCNLPIFQIETDPQICTRVGNLDVYAKGSCSSTYNASMQPICPRPENYRFNHIPPYPGTSTNQFLNYCNYMAAPACAAQFCTSGTPTCASRSASHLGQAGHTPCSTCLSRSAHRHHPGRRYHLLPAQQQQVDCALPMAQETTAITIGAQSMCCRQPR